MTMQMAAEPRCAKKNETKAIRRAGGIPAIIYSKGEKGSEFSVDATEFQKILQSVEKGTLSSKIFELEIDGKKVRAILKDIQYHVTTYRVLHLDFEQLHDDIEVTLNIPITFSGVVDCAGVKLGGVIRRVIDHMKVRCLPKHIPDSFTLDVREMTMGKTKRLSEIAIPEGVRPIVDLNEVAVLIAKR